MMQFDYFRVRWLRIFWLCSRLLMTMTVVVVVSIQIRSEAA